MLTEKTKKIARALCLHVFAVTWLSFLSYAHYGCPVSYLQVGFPTHTLQGLFSALAMDRMLLKLMILIRRATSWN